MTDKHQPLGFSELAPIDVDLSIPELEEDILLVPMATPQKKPKTPITSYEAKVFTFTGAAGGTGVTSLVIQTAFNFAKPQIPRGSRSGKHQQSEVCIVDLDFDSGACCHHLDLRPSMSDGDLCKVPADIDKAYVSSLISTHRSGISLLAAPNKLGNNDKVNPKTITAILDALCEMFDYVLIDTPRLWRPANMAAIIGSDRMIIVTDLTIPSLHLTRQRLLDMNPLRNSECDVVLNKYERRSFRNSLRENDVQKALGRDITAKICIDSDTVREAVMCGEPAGVIRPESRFVKDVRTLGELLLESQDDESQHANENAA